MSAREKWYLGIDIGGSSAKHALISTKGELREKGSFSTGDSASFEDFLSKLYAVTDGAILQRVDGIGLCSPGFIQAQSGLILGGFENLPYLHHLNLKELLKKRYPALCVHICNDAKAVALGEKWVGAAKDCKSFFCLTLGTGLGGALVLEGKLVEGSHFRAGEIGYLNYENQDRYFEKEVSTKIILKRAAKMLALPTLDGIEFFRLVRGQHPAMLNVFEGWMADISRFIANIIILLDLDMVIIGGGISSEGNLLIPYIEQNLLRMLPPQFYRQARIVAAHHANDAGMLGAVSDLALGNGANNPS